MLTETLSQISFAELFGNTHPVEIEIGCGKGKFLLARAEASPEINFLGIDRVAKWMKIGDTRRGKRGIQNLIFHKAEIREFLGAVAADSVAAFHIYFPDPWPKRRHRPRRLVSADFLRLLYPRLQSDGVIEIATDDADYFSAIQKAITASELEWRAIRESRNQRLVFETMKTNYELKYETAGKSLYYLELQK